MNDLRHDPAAHADDPRTTYGDRFDDYSAGTPDKWYADPRVLRADQLRTVPMPDLRSAAARTLDAEHRDLRPYADRADERLAALEEAIDRIANVVQVLVLERDVARMEQERGCSHE